MYELNYQSIRQSSQFYNSVNVVVSDIVKIDRSKSNVRRMIDRDQSQFLHHLRLHGKNDFAERSKILAGYRSEK